MDSPSHLRYLWWLGGLLALVLLVYLVSLFFSAATSPAEQERTDIPRGFPQDIPTPQQSDVVPAQSGFQYLVSFTDRGFEPKAVSIKKNETVRFTNNSSGMLWVTAGDGAQVSCPAGVLDSCKALARGEYWQYTFTETGAILFKNSVDGSVGSVRVE